jgi:8-amino-7-oxononanoate synthase
MIVDLLHEELSNLAQQGLQRRHRVVASPCTPEVKVDGKNVVAFCSNDYLGLANDPELVKALAAGAKKWGVGAGASHLICGHQSPHEQLEVALAEFVGAEKALLFSTGYMANLGLVTSLIGRGDEVFADRLNHASLIDAVQLSRAEHMRYPHCDVGILKGQLAATTARRKMILTDGVFSMDGDVAPLPELFDLAEKHDAFLVVDDAHGFGVLGPHGEGSLAHFGIAAHPRIVYMGTLGKAAGVSGAFVAGSAVVIDYLLQTSRTHIFTTAQPPALAATLLKSLKMIEAADGRRAHLAALVEQLRRGLAGLPWELVPQTTPTAIQPLIVGSNEDALRLTDGLLKQGYWVPAIRPPTVAVGKARLRITLSAAHTEAQVDGLLAALHKLA